jgi:hypothetical protein
MTRTQVGGSATSLSVGTVTTGQPGTSAAATISNGVLNLTIPQGATGATGLQGPAGSSTVTAVSVAGTVPVYNTHLEASAAGATPPYMIKTLDLTGPFNTSLPQNWQLPGQINGVGLVNYPHVAVNNTTFPRILLTITKPQYEKNAAISGASIISWIINVQDVNSSTGWDSVFQRFEMRIGSSTIAGSVTYKPNGTSSVGETTAPNTIQLQFLFTANGTVTFSFDHTQEANANWTLKHEYWFRQNASSGGLVYRDIAYYPIGNGTNIVNGDW